MDIIFMNSGNSKTPDPHRPLLNLLDKINLKRSDKYVALSNLSIYYTRKNIKTTYKNNEFKISTPTWNEVFKLPDGSQSVSDIQNYFEYIIKTKLHFDVITTVEKVADNSSIKIYVNKMEYRTTFKVKAWYYLKLLVPETMKLLGSTKSKITKDKNGENVPH